MTKYEKINSLFRMSIRTFQQSTPKLGQNVYVDPNASIIGNVTIGDDCSIWPFASIRGDMHSIVIGNRTNIQDNCTFHITHPSDYHPDGFPLIIGDDVTVGHRVILHACTVEDRCVVGMGSIVLDGAVLKSDIILGAGSLVPPGKILESGYLWVGSPVVKKRLLTDQEIEFLLYSANNYVSLKNQYLNE